MNVPTYQSLQWLEIFRYLYKKRKHIVIVIAIVSMSAVIGSLLLDNMYKSSANLLPNKNNTLGFGLFSDNGGLQSLKNSVLSGESEENNRFYVLLESYSTKKNVVEKFDLINIYETADSQTPLLNAINTLEGNTFFEGKEEGNFIIEVWDTNPERAKKIADYYVKLLNEFNTRISTLEAREFRNFIELRYKKSLQELDSLRNELARFQSKYGIFELPSQVNQYFSLISGITAKRYEASIKLSILERSVKKSNDTYKQTKDRLEVLDQKLNEIYRDNDNQNLMLNFKELPQTGRDYFNILKEIQIQEEVQKFILPIYEQAKMQEAKSLSIVTTVDPPHVPPKKSYPQRSIICILAFITAVISSVLFYIVKLHWQKNRDFYQHIISPE